MSKRSARARESVRKMKPRRSLRVKDRDGCPTPAKRHFADKTSALLSISDKSKKGKKRPVRAYRCPCGGWCLTSKEARR